MHAIIISTHLTQSRRGYLLGDENTAMLSKYMLTFLSILVDENTAMLSKYMLTFLSMLVDENTAMLSKYMLTFLSILVDEMQTFNISVMHLRGIQCGEVH